MIDLRQEAKDAIRRYYCTPEGQDEILLSLQKGGKWRTLSKTYSKEAMSKLIEDDLIENNEAVFILTHKGLTRLFTLAKKEGTPE